MSKAPYFFACLAFFWFGIAAIRGKGWTGEHGYGGARPFKPTPVTIAVGLVLLGLGVLVLFAAFNVAA